jgi:hypothetical protein
VLPLPPAWSRRKSVEAEEYVGAINTEAGGGSNTEAGGGSNTEAGGGSNVGGSDSGEDESAVLVVVACASNAGVFAAVASAPPPLVVSAAKQKHAYLEWTLLNGTSHVIGMPNGWSALAAWDIVRAPDVEPDQSLQGSPASNSTPTIVANDGLNVAPTAGSLVFQVSLGGHGYFNHGAGPTFFSGGCTLPMAGTMAGSSSGSKGQQHQSPVQGRVASCKLVRATTALDPPSASVAKMAVSTMLAVPSSDFAGEGDNVTVLAGMLVGDYFDGYVPPVLLASTDGAVHFGNLSQQLGNFEIAALSVDPRGRVCAATNGNGVQCFFL